jgi:DNA-binding transcriptional ArsR family regulator
LRRTHSSTGAAALESSASLFAALGDATRLRLVRRLCDHGPMSITELSAGFPMTRQGVTKHLRVMGKAGLVRSAQQGRETLWQLEQSRIGEARRHLEAIAAHWDTALGRLRRLVDE